MTISMFLNLVIFLMRSSVSCLQCSHSGLKIIIITAFFFGRLSFAYQLVLSTMRILNGGRVGNRLYGGMDVESTWANTPRVSDAINKVKTSFFMTQRNDILRFSVDNLTNAFL